MMVIPVGTKPQPCPDCGQPVYTMPYVGSHQRAIVLDTNGERGRMPTKLHHGWGSEHNRSCRTKISRRRVGS